MPTTEQREKAVPDWVNKTPRGCSYSLIMFGPSDDAEQEIDISEKEYLALKNFLARTRGLAPRVGAQLRAGHCRASSGLSGAARARKQRSRR